MKAPSFHQISIILRVIIDNHWRHAVPFYQTSWTTVTAGNMWMARNTELADVYTDGTNF